MKFSFFIFSTISVFTFFFFSSCSDVDDVEVPNEEEVITSVFFNLTDGSGTTYSFSFIDPDGDGGAAPIINSPTLPTNTTFNGIISVLNQSINPNVDITAEVFEEGTEHQFFYVVNNADLSIDYSDSDSNGAPLGIQTSIATGAAGTGSLTIILRHEPDKNAAGVNIGNPNNAGGETDIEVTFGVTIN